MKGEREQSRETLWESLPFTEDSHWLPRFFKTSVRGLLCLSSSGYQLIFASESVHSLPLACHCKQALGPCGGAHLLCSFNKNAFKSLFSLEKPFPGCQSPHPVQLKSTGALSLPLVPLCAPPSSHR